jgi:parallel beta-helix repeat protein
MKSKLVLHIAVAGSDGWSGTLAAPNDEATDGPLASLVEARNRIRRLRQDGRLHGPVEVLIHAGLYEITETVYFTEADLGDAGTPVTYRAAGDGEVRLSGGLRLQGFVHHEGAVVKLDLAAAGYLDLRFRQLFCNGARQHPARYPNYDERNPYTGGWLYVEGEPPSIYEAGHGENDRFICGDPRLRDWSKIREVEVFVYPRYNWQNNILRIRRYDPETGEILLDGEAEYEIYPGDRFYFQHVREEVDAAGEWYLDREKQILYYHPPMAVEDAVITVPTVENVIVVEGATPTGRHFYNIAWIDWEDERQVSRDPDLFEHGYLTFQGLTVEGCNGAAIVVRNVRGCEIVACTIRNTGNEGIAIHDGSQCMIEGCDIYETGGNGVALSGGMRSPFRGVYKGCGHEVRNNYIHHIATHVKHRAGISINGVGIVVAHNLIHDCPRWGILSRGNDNVLEYNHIRHVNIETSDTAAIYLVDRDPSLRGTVIRYNHLHDVLGYHRIDGEWRSPAYAFGIYLDDWTSGVEIRGNLIYRTPRAGIYLHAGQDNLVENNVVVDSLDEMGYFRRWGPDIELQHLGTHDQGLRRNLFRRNILASRFEGVAAYSFGHSATVRDPMDLATNQWDQNLLWNGGASLRIRTGTSTGFLSWESWQAMGFDRESMVADPLFVDAGSDNFTLRQESPAFALGIEPLPIDKMGPYASDRRATWPIVEAEGARENFPVRYESR